MVTSVKTRPGSIVAVMTLDECLDEVVLCRLREVQSSVEWKNA